MKQLKKRMSRLAAALCCLLLLVSCGREAEKVTLRVCVGGVQTSLDPAMTTTDDNATILLHLYENLMRLESDGAGGTELVKGVASNYEENENYDGTVSCVFTISPTAHWSDGQSVTAQDFVYAWQRLVDPATASPNRSLLSMVKGYSEAVSEKDSSLLAVTASEDGATLSVVLSYHCPFFVNSICASAATMPVRQDVVERYGADWGAIPQALVTNGAYIMGAWNVNETLSLVRNPQGGGTRGADELTFVFAADAEAADELFKSGDVAFCSYLPESAVSAQKAAAGWTPVPYAETDMVLYNRLGALSDKAARQAFSLTIDYDALNALLEPDDMLATGLVPYGILESDGEDFRTVGGALVDVSGAGYEGRCETAIAALQAEKLALQDVEYIYRAGEREQAIAEALQSAWQTQLNIRVKLTPLDAETLHDRILAGDYDLAELNTHANYADAMAFLYRWGGAPTEEGDSTDTYSTLLSVIRGALDPLARDNYLHAAEAEVLEQYMTAPLYFRGTACETADGLQNVCYDGMGHYRFHAVSFGE